MTPKKMTDKVLRPLAIGLAQQAWTIWDLEQHLRQRLPKGFEKTPGRLARELVSHFPARLAPDASQITTHLQRSPAAKTIRSHAERTGTFPAIPAEAPAFRPAPDLGDCGLPALETPQDLAEWLALPQRQLIRFSDLRGLSARSENTFAPHYRQHLHPKSDGRLRLLEEPKPLLKRLQRRVLQHILNPPPPHEAAYGFRVGRNAAQAAARHAGEEVVICFDLKAFFPSIGHHRVYAVFRRLGYPAAVAQHLSGLCTALTPPTLLAHPELAARAELSTRHLPQGAPTSPALANLVAFGLDTRLAGLAQRISANYTRYADDLTFSGARAVTPILMRAVPEIVRECGFTLGPHKTRVQPASARQLVTGIVVNQHLNLPRETYDQLKAIIHHLGRADDPRRTDMGFLTHLDGRIAWVEQLHPMKGARLRTRLAQALQE